MFLFMSLSSKRFRLTLRLHIYIFLYFLRLCVAGVEQSRLLGPEVSAFTIDGLQPDEALVIGVAALAGERVGEVVALSSRTNPHSGSVSGLRTTDVTAQRIRITWSPSSRATGYRIMWRSDNGKQQLLGHTRNSTCEVYGFGWWFSFVQVWKQLVT